MTARPIENALLATYSLVVLSVSAWLAAAGGPWQGAVLCVVLAGAVVTLHVTERGRG